MKEIIYITKYNEYEHLKDKFFLVIKSSDNNTPLVRALARLCLDTCKSCLGGRKSVDDTNILYITELTFTTLRIAERTAESISYLTGIPCKWHESFGRITKPVIQPSECSM